MFDRSTMSKRQRRSSLPRRRPPASAGRNKSHLPEQLVRPGRARRAVSGRRRGQLQKYGLDVTVKMGGPQVNGLQLLAAGQVDIFMGFDIQKLQGPGAGHSRR